MNNRKNSYMLRFMTLLVGLLFSFNIYAFDFKNVFLLDNNQEDPHISSLLEYINSNSSMISDVKNLKKNEEVISEAYFLLTDNYVLKLDEKHKQDIVDKSKKMIEIDLVSAKKDHKKISAEDLEAAVLNTMFNSLDPHTAWMNKSDTETLKNSIDGEYEGVGLVLGIDNKTDLIKILDVVEGGPAFKQGIKKGDLIYSVNGKDYTSKQIDIASNVMRGKKGTKVILGINHDGNLKKYTITRAKVNLVTVDSEVLDNKYAYIRIATFNFNTTAQFRKTVKKLDINNKAGIILDLRNDPGGLLYSSLIIADMFIDDGLLLSVKGNKSEYDMSYYASKNMDINKNIPLIILVNNMTASAAEIVSAALSQNNRATVMGQTSFGKGSVQTIFDLKDKSSAKITIQLFYTPNEQPLQGVGVIPDVEIEKIHKSAFDTLHETSYKNVLVVNSKKENKKIVKMKEKDCRPAGKFKDQTIGCALQYLENNTKMVKHL